jgi:hypothetical protein
LKLLLTIAGIPTVQMWIAYPLLVALIVLVVAVILARLTLPPRQPPGRLPSLTLFVRKPLHHLVLPPPAFSLIQIRAFERPLPAVLV